MEGTWREGTPLYEDNGNHSAYVYGGKIYTYSSNDFGAFEEDNCPVVYDPKTDTYKSLSTKVLGSHSYPIFVANDIAYYFCSLTGNHTIERYDLTRNVWLESRSHAIGQVYSIAYPGQGDIVYLLEITTPYSLYEYNFITDTYTLIVEGNNFGTTDCIAFLDEKIYYPGSGDMLCVYDLVTGGINEFDPGLEDLTDVCFTYQNKIVVIGGDNNAEAASIPLKMRMYDPLTNEWSDGPDLPYGWVGSNLSVATVDDAIYIWGNSKLSIFEPGTSTPPTDPDPIEPVDPNPEDPDCCCCNLLNVNVEVSLCGLYKEFLKSLGIAINKAAEMECACDCGDAETEE